jgi:GNAT superfamily N-acetyltransferase
VRSCMRLRYARIMSGDFEIRLATRDDAEVIARHRGLMFLDMGKVSRDESEQIRNATEPHIRKLLETDQYVGWLVIKNEEVVAGGGAYLRELLPIPGCSRLGRWAYIANIYTEEAHRRQGLARLVVSTILQWCEEHGIDQITLAASDAGRPLYESLGFVPTADMRLPRKRP